jgi:hypothetical protein
MKKLSLVYTYQHDDGLNMPLIIEFGWHRGTTAHNGDNPDMVEVDSAKDVERKNWWPIIQTNPQARDELEEACYEYAKSRRF